MTTASDRLQFRVLWEAIDLALTGDLAALRPCVDRILPLSNDRPAMHQ
jgi:hypothetical protein